MHTTFSALAVLGLSLLVRDVLAVPMKRNLIIDEVLVTEELQVIQHADGTLETVGAPVVLSTVTKHGSTTVFEVAAAAVTPPVVTPTTTAVSTSASSSSSVGSVLQVASGGAVFIEAHKSNGGSSSSAYTPPVQTTTHTPTTPAYTPPTSSAAAATSSTPVTGGGSSASGVKRGVSYNDASLLKAFTTSQVGWAYNWASSSAGMASSLSGAEFVPMLWGKDNTGWSTNANAAIASGSKHLLAFNEPDYCDNPSLGSCMDPGTAATLYHNNMKEFYGTSVKLGAPAVTNGQTYVNSAGKTVTMGIDWLTQFFTACKSLSCQVDFVPFHWYGDASNYADLSKHIGDMQAFNKPLWITEFRAQSGDETSFVKSAIPQLDSDTRVDRYAYFMASDGILFSGTSLSTVGQAYANAA